MTKSVCWLKPWLPVKSSARSTPMFKTKTWKGQATNPSASGGHVIIYLSNLLASDPLPRDLLPENFPAFFYRTQHRWYFNHNSLSYCFKNAAENKAELRSIRFAHTFGISNTLAWLREKCPKGNLRLEGINSVADKLWASYLESSRQTDTLYLLAEKGNL